MSDSVGEVRFPDANRRDDGEVADLSGSVGPGCVDLEADALVEGTWQIDTESSTYIFDATARTITRWPGGAGTLDGIPVVHVHLRRDEEEITVIAASRPIVGQPWRLALDLRRDGIVTWRTTTGVCHLKRLA